MPSRYTTSKFRLVLLALLLGAAAALLLAGGGTSFAQNAAAPVGPGSGAGSPTGTSTGAGLISLIFSHVDFVFITIALLSIIGMTLIIQGFIQNRESVLLPPETIGRIREMI